MIKYNPLYKNDGTLNLGLSIAPSESIVFDVPGKCIWVKGVKLKGINNTYTFSHDNYITLTNTPDPNDSEIEDIKIGVNITTLKAAIDTTYDIVSSTANGLAPKFSAGNLADSSASTSYSFLGLQGSTLKWYTLPHRNVYVNTTEVQSVSNTDPLKFVAGNGITITWNSTDKCIEIVNSKPDINHNTDFQVGLYVTSTNSDYRILLKKTANDTEETATARFATTLTFNPSTNVLKINGNKVITVVDVYTGATFTESGIVGLVPVATSAQRHYFLRGDGTWQDFNAQNTWRIVKVEGTQKLASTTDTDALDFHGDTGIEITYDATNKRVNIKNTAPDQNHNTDFNVQLTPQTDNINRPLMMINGGTTVGEQTTTTIFSTGIYANTSTKMIIANGFVKAGSDDTYVLLGGGSHKALSDFSMSHNHPYLPLAGGTMTLGEGLKFHSDNNYFGTDCDARIISLLDSNDTICDGGLIIDERATSGGVEYITELLRIRDNEFKWKGNIIWHAGNDGSSSGLDADLLDGYHASDFATLGHNHDGRYARTHWEFASGSDDANVTCTSLDTWVSRLSAVGGISNYGSISVGAWWWVRSTDLQVNSWNIRTAGAMMIYGGDGNFNSKNYKHFLVLDAYADLYGITSNEESWKYYAKFLSTKNYTDYVYTKTLSDDRYVNITGDTMTGNLIVPCLSVGNSSTSNFLEFHGLTGDNGVGNTWDYHFMIGNRIWNSSTEASELIIVCENDVGNGNSSVTGYGSGPDRIRHIAAAHLFLTYTATISGTLETIATSSYLKNIFEINTNSIHSWVPAIFDDNITTNGEIHTINISPTYKFICTYYDEFFDSRMNLHLGPQSGDFNIFKDSTYNASSNLLCIKTSSGNIGMGTPSPAYRLHIIGSVYSTQAGLFGNVLVGGYSMNSTESNANIEFLTGTGYIDWHYDGSTSDYTTRLIENASGKLTLYGDLGIGVIPSYKLDVAGDIQANSGLVYSSGFYHNSYGSPDYFLTSDGGARYVTDVGIYTKTITVTGDSNTYYPVRIPSSDNKRRINTISVWRNLGETSYGYPANHSGYTNGEGGCSCWYEFVGRTNRWDGNGGYYYTRRVWYGYDRLLSHASAPGGPVGDLFVWLRGGGTVYNISTNYPIDNPTIYYSRTNASGSDQYPSYVEPMTTVGNEGILGKLYYGDISGNADTVDGYHASSFSLTSHNHDSRYLRKDTNDSTPYQYSFTKTDDHAIQVGTIRGRAVGSQTGEFIHLYERVAIGSPSGWGSRNAPSYGLATYGGAWLATDTGNVGIGTMSPAHKLDVYSTSMIIGNSTGEAHIYARTSNFSEPSLSFYDDTNGYGIMTVLGGGGCTIVGGGESAHTFAPNVRDENLYLTADANVNIFTNLNGGYESRRHVAQFNTNGDTYLYGNLYLGANASNNFIAFYGNTGDDPGYYQTSFIGEHLWGSPESTELLLMKFNDVGNNVSGTTVFDVGPDRIRHLAHAHVFQIMTSTALGDFVTMANSTECETKLEICRNCINSFASIILKGGTSTDMTYNGNVHPALRFDNSDSSQNIAFIFTDYDSYRDPAGIKLVGNLGNEWFEAPRIYSTFHHTSRDNDDSLLLAGGGYRLLNDLPYAPWKELWIDMTGYSESYWHPVVTGLPYSGYKRIKVTVQLNSGTAPSWSTHPSGFTCNLDLWVTAHGWGTTSSETICLNSSYAHANLNPVGWFQLGNASHGILLLRGGGKYLVCTDWDSSWTIYNQSVTDYGGTQYAQTCGPYTSWPGIFNGSTTKNWIYAHLRGNIITDDWLSIRDYSGSYHGRSNNISGYAGEIYFGGNFHIDSQNGLNMYLNYYTSATVSIAQGGGYVGIGTDSPSYKLHIAGSAYSTLASQFGNVRIGGSAMNAVDGNASIEMLTGTGYIDWHYNGSTSDYTTRLIENSSGSLTLYGNLGLSRNPSYKLDVNGNIRIGSQGSEAHLYGYLTNNDQAFLSIYNDPNGYGLRTCLGGGGCTVVGAGESAHEFAPNYNDENLYLIADNNVEIYTYVDTFSSRRNVASFRTDYTSHFMGDTYCHGNLYVGGNASNNFIAFYGNTGDDPGAYATTFIGEHLWGGKESTELLLMKFNDVGNGTDGTTVYDSGPDRIRYCAHAHLFQIRTNAGQGSFATMAADENNKTVLLLALNRMTVHTDIHITGSTTSDMSYSTSNPKIYFSENGGQAVGIVYTDWDAYRASKGLKVMDVNNDDISNVWFEVQGNCYAPNFYTISDRNKKKNIVIFSEHIRKFQLKDTEKYAYGVIAQEVEEMFREGGEGNMTVNYNSVLSFYIGQLENKVKILEERIKRLESK